MIREYLVCYDYGTGGLWWWITANSPDEITAKYTGVIVLDQVPDWWSDDMEALTEHRLLTDPDTGGLVTLRRQN